MIQDVVILGGGLVGSLVACLLLQQQPQPRVRVYELHSDIRKQLTSAGKSINLALSHRGLRTLRRLNPRVVDQIEAMMLPMKGRMLHPGNKEVLYGVNGECINSVDRKKLNEILLDEFEKEGGQIYFEHVLQQIDFDKSQSTFLVDGKDITVSYDLLVGCDGAYSQVRSQMMRRNRMEYTQTYIDHGYMELNILQIDGEYAMSENHLHIWPKHSFMMIALPNVDKSFTTTLFMPYAKFDELKANGPEAIVKFFEQNFGDAIPLLGGEQEVIKAMQTRPVGSMVSIKCSPYNYKNTVIIGDAIHAMVPFYGQGMNAGFEDVLVLEQFLYDPRFSSLEQKLEAFTEFRQPDAHAICDLAMYNYHEMRSDVLTLSYRTRKFVESTLNRIVPWLVIPLYSMVSFSHIRYSLAVRKWKRQSLVYSILSGAFVGGVTAASGLLLYRHRHQIQANMAAVKARMSQ